MASVRRQIAEKDQEKKDGEKKDGEKKKAARVEAARVVLKTVDAWKNHPIIGRVKAHLVNKCRHSKPFASWRRPYPKQINPTISQYHMRIHLRAPIGRKECASVVVCRYAKPQRLQPTQPENLPSSTRRRRRRRQNPLPFRQINAFLSFFFVFYFYWRERRRAARRVLSRGGYWMDVGEGLAFWRNIPRRQPPLHCWQLLMVSLDTRCRCCSHLRV